MQLTANKTAKFFIQNEYHNVSLDNDYLVLSSESREERIPFNIWSGRVDLKRGLIWARCSSSPMKKMANSYLG
ncbi:DNA helicase IV [Vibrio ponticus]|nr:DNA helicase IV [Vibrio ponticus]